MDTRWDNSDHVPLTNGPLIVTTPPAVPSARLVENGQIIEFLVPFPMHIVDTRSWTPLEGTLNAKKVLIHKPVPVVMQLPPEGRLGNESPDAFACILRVSCSPELPNPSYPTAAECWQLVESVLNWIRVKARHYWLLHGQKGFGTLFRGSVFSQDGTSISQKNVSTYGPNVIVRPLDESLWLSIKSEIDGKLHVPVSEALFCDALISAVAGDEMKAVLEMGIAVEVEITQLLTEAAHSLPNTHQKQKFAAKGERDKFYEKLCQWPQKLGLDEANIFTMAGLYPKWVAVVKEMYRLRGSAVHSGSLSGTKVLKLPDYLFATNALFAYSRAQRTKAGLPVYAYSSGRNPSEQIIAAHDGQFSSETSPAVTTLA
ncbi:MAG TPA: hypothetical protein VNW97_07005 [Candidatus Saccharimonadales bacterium]|jgi:hypothetical protein|nr:hypothetical protein [Candidatus Saccharimonadales bacterium]